MNFNGFNYQSYLQPQPNFTVPFPSYAAYGGPEYQIYEMPTIAQVENSEQMPNGQFGDLPYNYGIWGKIAPTTESDRRVHGAAQKENLEFALLYSTQSNKTSGNIPQTFRRWEIIDNNCNATSRDNSIKIKVVSYNVLAQYLLEWHPELYTGCKPQHLEWEHRSDCLFDEIVKLDPDILCLQEVQASHLDSFYNKFEEMGYCELFLKKSQTGYKDDGCAIYYKQSTFKLLDQLDVPLYQSKVSLLNRDNVGVIIKLVPHDMPDSPFVVATTHLLYNPRRTDVRLAQMKLFLAEIDKFAYDNNKKGHLPIILTGDFNSTPDTEVIQLLDEGRVSVEALHDNSEWKSVGITNNCQHLNVKLNREKGVPLKDEKSDNTEDTNEATEELAEAHNDLFAGETIEHSLSLLSAYDKVKDDGGAEATTFQDHWVTVDYIYFNQHNSLKLAERLRLPTADECLVLGSLPNGVYGSDHLALGAVFELKSTTHQSRL